MRISRPEFGLFCTCSAALRGRQPVRWRGWPKHGSTEAAANLTRGPGNGPEPDWTSACAECQLCLATSCAWAVLFKESDPYLVRANTENPYLTMLKEAAAAFACAVPPPSWIRTQPWAAGRSGRWHGAAGGPHVADRSSVDFFLDYFSFRITGQPHAPAQQHCGPQAQGEVAGNSWPRPEGNGSLRHGESFRLQAHLRWGKTPRWWTRSPSELLSLLDPCRCPFVHTTEVKFLDIGVGLRLRRRRRGVGGTLNSPAK